jgi:hypothetical protein
VLVPREEDKHRRAEVCNPAREEEDHVGAREIGGVKTGQHVAMNKVSCMVEHHYDHDNATQEID